MWRILHLTTVCKLHISFVLVNVNYNYLTVCSLGRRHLSQLGDAQLKYEVKARQWLMRQLPPPLLQPQSPLRSQPTWSLSRISCKHVSSTYDSSTHTICSKISRWWCNLHIPVYKMTYIIDLCDYMLFVQCAIGPTHVYENNVTCILLVNFSNYYYYYYYL